MRRVLVAMAVVLCVSGVALGEVPQVIGYQGRITDNAGVPVADGTYDMRFLIYDNSGGSGSPLWDTGTHSEQVADGIFNVLLGEAPHPALTLAFDQDYWLAVTFEGEVQTPLKRLASTGYAYMASGLVPGTIVTGEVTTGPKAAVAGMNTATTGVNYGLYGAASSTEGWAVYGEATAASGMACGVSGVSAATDGRGVLGLATATSGAATGLYGITSSTGGYGVFGSADATAGATIGVLGRSMSPGGRGVSGEAEASYGSTCYGVYGRSASTAGRGVYGWATASTGYNYGVYGESSSTEGEGVYGYASATTGTTSGVHGFTSSTSGKGVYGGAGATTGYAYGIYGESSSTSGRGTIGWARATTGTTYGVWGLASSTEGRGVYGYADNIAGTNYAVYGLTNSASGYAGFFQGRVHVNGNLTKASGSFLIDHPLDPENKLLRHNFVESPENLLIYRGKVRLDADGQAAVQMPEYFKALTTEEEATITLTPIGKPFLMGYELLSGHDGFVAYGEPNREVSWVVYADRDDPVMRQLARPVEEVKGPDNEYCDRGKLLHPTAYGYPESMGRDYELHERDRRWLEEERARTEREAEEAALLKR